MPTKEPADVFYATNNPVSTPDPEPAPPKPKPKKKPVDTPPGPINLELRTAPTGQQTRIQVTQRIYDYSIEQTDDTITITGYLKPKTDA